MRSRRITPCQWACALSALLVAAWGSPALSADVLSAGGFSFEQGVEYVPIEPVPAEFDVEVVRGGVIADEDIRLLTKEEMLAKFADSRSMISVARKGRDGKLTFLDASLTAEKGTYVAFMDYTKFYVDDLLDEDGEKIGRGRIGVGLRLVARVVTTKKGIDLGSLLKIGFAASQKHLTGTMEVRAIGITSDDIDPLLPGILPAVDEASIQSALESMAAVKAKIWDDNTTLSPRVIAIRPEAARGANAFAAPE